jgi:hypothetical protein
MVVSDLQDAFVAPLEALAVSGTFYHQVDGGGLGLHKPPFQSDDDSSIYPRPVRSTIQVIAGHTRLAFSASSIKALKHTRR